MGHEFEVVAAWSIIESVSASGGACGNFSRFHFTFVSAKGGPRADPGRLFVFGCSISWRSFSFIVVLVN